MKSIKLSAIILASLLSPALFCTSTANAQQLTSNTTEKVQITKGATPATLKRKLKEGLELKVVRNLISTSFAVKITPDVEAKLPQLVELLGASIQLRFEPSDGEYLFGSAAISVPSAKLKEYLANMEIGAGDIAASAARILVSIDEFIGVATSNNAQTAIETETNIHIDKSNFSDTSAKSSGSQNRSAAASSYNKTDVASASKESAAVAGKQSSSAAARSDAAYAAKQDTAYAGQRDSAVAVQGDGGSGAAASRTQVAGASNTQVAAAKSSQYAAAQSSQYAAASSSERAFVDKSLKAGSSSSASASASSSDQKNIQQQTDVTNISVKTKMPEFNNAKPMGAGDRVLVARLSGEFQDNGLKLVAENDLRSEGGRTLPIFEITNNGRIDQFVELIRRKNIEADVWATGQANYTIVGTTSTGTMCNGTLSVQGRFLEGNDIFFEDSLPAEATGVGDQDCRAKLGTALATALARTLGERANKALNARSSRGGVYTLFLYSASALQRSDRRAFVDELTKIAGVKASEPTVKENYIAISVQYAGSLKKEIDNVLDKMPPNWNKAAILDKANKICVGIEGGGACPQEFR